MPSAPPRESTPPGSRTPGIREATRDSVLCPSPLHPHPIKWQSQPGVGDGHRHPCPQAGCSVESALEAASLHPAQLLGLEKRKGTLDFGADAGQGPTGGSLGQGWGGGRWAAGRHFLIPRGFTWPGPWSGPAFPSGRPGFLASEMGLVRVCGSAVGCPLLPGALLPGPHLVCDGPGCPAEIVFWALVPPPQPRGGGSSGPASAPFSPPPSDPDFVVLDDSLHVRATYISGELVWQVEEARP